MRRRIHCGRPALEGHGSKQPGYDLYERRSASDGSRIPGSDHRTWLVRDVSREMDHEDRGRPGRIQRILATEGVDELELPEWHRAGPNPNGRDHRHASG